MEQHFKKKLVYGGMATAMAVVLIAGVTTTQLKDMAEGSADTSLVQLTGQTAPAEIKTKDDSAAMTASVTEAAPVPVRQDAPAEFHRLEMDAMTATNTPAPSPIAPPVAAEAEMMQERAAVASDMATAGAPAANRAMIMSKQVAPGYAGVAVNEIMPYPQPDYPSPYYQDQGRDRFESFKVNPIKVVGEEPVSTFSVDVDTASYSFMRRQINMGGVPSADSIRVEELINYFDYNYPLPETREQPFKPTVTLTPSPWNEGKQLMHIGIKGFDVEGGEQPRSNLVFLLDVSGSMNSPDKLPLVKSSLKMLLDTLRPDDTIAIAVYAGAAGTVLEPTPASDKAKIFAALDNLQAGGSTAGAAGINLAYQLAQQNFVKDGVNRVILATDGDFNVGVSSPEELKKMVEEKRKSGVFLSILGFGQGNLNDELMQSIAQNGNGTAAYIDTLNEARKVLVEEATSTLFPIAKDVKIQIEFNPAQVAEYRLVGYETRALNREDFNNDKIDAGDIGAGHTVTAIYEITPVGSQAVSVDPLRYGEAEKAAPAVEQTTADANFGSDLAFLKIRYKLPNEDVSKLITTPVTTANFADFPQNCVCPANAICEPCPPQASQDVQFATAVATFGQLLKGGDYVTNVTYDDVIAMAESGKGADTFGYRAEFINLVKNAKAFSSQNNIYQNPYQPRAE